MSELKKIFVVANGDGTFKADIFHAFVNRDNAEAELRKQAGQILLFQEVDLSVQPEAAPTDDGPMDDGQDSDNQSTQDPSLSSDDDSDDDSDDQNVSASGGQDDGDSDEDSDVDSDDDSDQSEETPDDDEDESANPYPDRLI